MIDNPANLFKQISHGVYVIGVTDGKRENAFTAAWVMQVSFQPPLLAFSINPANFSYQLLQAGKACTVNVLGQNHYAIAEHFGRSGLADKMTGYRWQKAQTGAPILADCLVYFDCKVSHFTDAGDHKIAVCEVQDAAWLNAGRPMLYNQTGEMDGSEKLY